MADAVRIVPNVTANVQNNTYFIHTDHLNTPRVIVDQNNQKRWTWYAEASEAFGAYVANDNPASLGTFTYNLRLPGQLYDLNSQLSYNYYRDYNPRTGRYLESDPIGLAGGINTYGYVSGNPVSLIDPSGLAAGGSAVGSQVGGYVGAALGSGIGLLVSPILGPEAVPYFRAGGRYAGAAAGSAAGSAIEDACSPGKSCPPCKTISGRIVPVGTIAYRPLDNPSSPQHGIVGAHYNIYKANQIPSPKCDCFWQPIGAVSPSNLPAGAIPIEPFMN